MASSTISIKRGNTWGDGQPPTLLNSDGTAYVLPDGAKILFTVKTINDRSLSDDTALIKKDFTSACTLTAADTDIAVDTYRYDMKVVSDGVERNSEIGIFEITDRVGVRDV